MRQRRALLDRPWEEDFLHWAMDGTLHGDVTPPSDGRRRSVTTDGWCPGWAVQMQRQYLSSSFGLETDADARAEHDDPGRSS